MCISKQLNSRRNSRLRLSLVVSVATLLVCTPAFSCGPFFTTPLVMDRQGSLRYLPEGDSYVELKKLLPKKEFSFVANELTELAEVETAGLSEKEIALVKAMRESSDAASALEVGKELPEALRFYTAGAVAFHAAIPPRENEENVQPPENSAELKALARQEFLAVLSLTEDAKKPRAVWAAFSLGRLAASDNNYRQATEYFSLARKLASQNYKDDYGLAVASYGEEAKVYLDMAEGRASLPDDLSKSEAFVKAAHLYAEQASYDSRSAFDSLRMTILGLMAYPQLIGSAMSDSLIQQLVYAYAFSGFFNDEQRLALLQMLDEQKVENIPNADTVAAFAYRAGRFELAEHFAAKSHSGLAAWVTAKLALAKGDQAGALAAYAEAIKAFPVDERWSSAPTPEEFVVEGVQPTCQLNAEVGILQLQRNDYLQALHYLLAGGADYWMDAAYVAERVLSVDELKSFVDQQVPGPSAEELEKAKQMGSSTPSEQLRHLLARRLMREARFGEAMNYFNDADIRNKAKTYGDLLAKSRSVILPKTFRAEALFKASKIARYEGMEIMGYEGAPDYASWDGLFEFGTPDNIAEDQAVSAQEKHRFDASKAKPEKRFHYRVIAADLARQAASLLPERSQAYAASLCEASHYLLARSPDEAAPFYKEYLKHGAYVPWGKQFGQQCPEPEFTRAFFQYPLEKYAQIKRHF